MTLDIPSLSPPWGEIALSGQVQVSSYTSQLCYNSKLHNLKMNPLWGHLEKLQFLILYYLSNSLWLNLDPDSPGRPPSVQVNQLWACAINYPETSWQSWLIMACTPGDRSPDSILFPVSLPPLCLCPGVTPLLTKLRHLDSFPLSLW